MAPRHVCTAREGVRERERTSSHGPSAKNSTTNNAATTKSCSKCTEQLDVSRRAPAWAATPPVDAGCVRAGGSVSFWS